MGWHISNALMKDYENSRFSPELEEVSSEESFLGGERFAPWKSAHFAQDDLCSAKMKDTFHHSPYGIMFVPSTDDLGMELLTWFRAGFHAKISARQICGLLESKGKEADCGLKCLGLFAKYDPNTFSWKTAQCSLFEDLDESLEIWPRWGIMQNGECFQLPMSERSIKEKGFLSLVPTPTASDWKRMPLKKEYSNKPITKKTADTLSQYMARTWFDIFRDQERWYPIPSLWEAINGWPEAWTGSEPLETGKFQQWLDSHGTP